MWMLCAPHHRLISRMFLYSPTWSYRPIKHRTPHSSFPPRALKTFCVYELGFSRNLIGGEFELLILIHFNLNSCIRLVATLLDGGPEPGWAWEMSASHRLCIGCVTQSKPATSSPRPTFQASVAWESTSQRRVTERGITHVTKHLFSGDFSENNMAPECSDLDSFHRQSAPGNKSLFALLSPCLWCGMMLVSGPWDGVRSGETALLSVLHLAKAVPFVWWEV